jgi:peptidoglycan/xylan/chitin deacetylase (PgdA/CDA1 family)
LQNKIKKNISSIISSINPFYSNNSFALTYHSINDSNHELTSQLYQLSIDNFKKQINYLNNNNFISTNISNIFDKKNHYTITFDDGYEDLYQICLKLLNVQNINCLIFLCPIFIKSKKRGYLSISQIKELSQYKNIEFGSHSYSHKNLQKLTLKDLEFEILDSKKWLEDNLNLPIRTFAYPFGKYDDRSLKILKSSDYNHAFNTKFGFVNNKKNNFEIPRIDIWNNDTISDFALKIKGKFNWLNFFYNLKNLKK